MGWHHRKILSVLFFSLLLIAPLPSHGEEGQRLIRVATLYGFAPLCFTDPPDRAIFRELLPPGQNSAHLRGYSWDIVRESLHSAGYTIELSVAPWARVYDHTLRGEYDLLFPTSRSNNRQHIFYFSKHPVNMAESILYVLKESLLESNDFNKMQEIPIAARKGFYYGPVWENISPKHVRKVPLEGIEQGFSMLLAKRVDAFAGYQATWDRVAQKMGISEEIRRLPIFCRYGEFVVTPRNNSEGVQAIQTIDAHLVQMQKSGEVEVLKERWNVSF